MFAMIGQIFFLNYLLFFYCVVFLYQLYRLCWSLRHNVEGRVEIEADDWINYEEDEMEVEGNWNIHFLLVMTDLKWVFPPL